MSVQNVGDDAKSGFGNDLSEPVETPDPEAGALNGGDVSDTEHDPDAETERPADAGDQQPGADQPEQPETEGDNPDH